MFSCESGDVYEAGSCHVFPSELISVTISCETDAMCVHNTFLIISIASDAAINKLHSSTFRY